ncbi:RNA-binding protein [Eubacterium sp. AF17-7]|uniref:YlmH family RNA-binding protein n=1 Tax=Eubacterium TaxID=1730 RepID=UPI000E4E2EE6|nr:YlmH/Sll1252 family protein [Eubacterium sp. AF17-7]RGG66663.1 RNA-binding protein [Eubacterium sp. AF17-7]
MNKEDNYVKNRLLDLADITYSKNIYAYSGFLNLNEINIFNTITNQLPPVNYYLTGGNVYAERKIVVFKPIEVYYEEDVPITLLKIEPLNKKYADTLNHRDYLGAILNLGIDRSKIGDIFIGENVAYIYVITGISDYIINNFTKVKHTLISCKIAYDEIENVRPNLKEIKGTIGNIRLDSIISLAFNKSRSSIVSYIEEKKVFVNGKIITSNGYSIKENDIISVRGLGRVIYNRQISVTKKGKNLVSVSIYC